MKKTTTGLLGLGVATVLALSPLGATIALADGETAPADPTTTATQNDAAQTPQSDVDVIPTEPVSVDESPGTGGAGQQDPDSSAGSGASDSEGSGATPPESPSTGPGNPNQGDPSTDDEPEVTAPSSPQYVYGYWESDGPTVWVDWLAPASSGSSPLTTYHVELTDQTDGTTQTQDVDADETAGDWNETPFTVTPGYDRVWDIAVTAENAEGELSPVATGAAASPESPRAPSAPRNVNGDYVVDGSSAAVEVRWSAPEDWGVTDRSQPVRIAGFGSSSYRYRITLDSGNGMPQVHNISALSSFPAFARSAVPGGSDTFVVDRGYDQRWTVTVEASNDDGDTWSPAGSTIVASPPSTKVTITSATTTGYRVPTVSIAWDAVNDERVVSWLVAVVNPAAQSSGSFFVAASSLPLGTTSTTFVGGESTDLGDDDIVGGNALPNSSELVVMVYGVDADGAPVAYSAPTTVTTNASAPPAPAEPTGASAGGVTVAVSGSTITATVPGAKPGQWVYGYAFSTPVGLGWTQVGADGTATWSLAAANLPAGQHHLAIVGDDGALLGSAAFSIGVTPAATTAQLASTGSDAATPLGAAALLVLAGVTLVALRRIRRTEGVQQGR